LKKFFLNFFFSIFSTDFFSSYFSLIVGASRALPLRRLLAITLRPPGDFIRLKKPCLFKRFVLLGWKVLFIANAP